MKNLAILVCLFALSGCATQLNFKGRRVQAVDTDLATLKDCKPLGEVTGTEMMGDGMNGDTASAKNKALNKTGELGGNIFRITKEQSSVMGASFTGEAYLCDLSAKTFTYPKRDYQAESLDLQRQQIDINRRQQNANAMKNLMNVVGDGSTTPQQQRAPAADCASRPVHNVYGEFVRWDTSCR
jgi:hypothetical protein